MPMTHLEPLSEINLTKNINLTEKRNSLDINLLNTEHTQSLFPFLSF